MDSIYLDHNATSPMLPEVAEAVARCHASTWGNPASQHQAGRRARQALEDARERISHILGAELTGPRSDRLIFTSGGTESNNLAILGLAGTAPGQAVISAIEHASVAGPAEHLNRAGWRIARLGVSSAGAVRVEELPGLLTDQTRLVSVMLGNNETGVVQPVRQLAERAAAAGVPFHTDAVQAVGKLPVDFRALGVATLSLSAHKFHGPRGIGALLVRHGARLSPILFGGFQQDGLRPGTEPVALAVGLCTALEVWHGRWESRREHLATLRDRFEAQLRAGWPEAVVNGGAAERLPHTSNVSFPGLDRQALAIALDLAGVACSTGSACASGASERSPTLLAMGLPAAVVEGALRFSFAATTTFEEVDEAARRILHVCKYLKTHLP
ncbi:MAG: cysteine desulfurase family protein [Pirellulales bacterium]